MELLESSCVRPRQARYHDGLRINSSVKVNCDRQARNAEGEDRPNFHLWVVGAVLERGEEHRFSARLLAASLGLDGHKYRIDLLQALCVFCL
jgi:hypothetical protein